MVETCQSQCRAAVKHICLFQSKENNFRKWYLTRLKTSQISRLFPVIFPTGFCKIANRAIFCIQSIARMQLTGLKKR